MVRNDHGDRTYSEAEMTPNPMRSEAAAPAQDLSLLSDAVVNELLREKGLRYGPEAAGAARRDTVRKRRAPRVGRRRAPSATRRRRGPRA